MKIPQFDLSTLVPGTIDSIPVPEGDFWVFAYGSLMWNPGFNYTDSAPAHLFGYHRRLCLWSVRYRGNENQPGLVLGLDKGGSCRGFAYKVDHNDTDEVLDYLCQRELVTGAYHSRICAIELPNQSRVDALTFISKRDHPHYATRLNLQQTVAVVNKARGSRGCNAEYVINTVKQMTKINITNTELHKLAEHLQ